MIITIHDAAVEHPLPVRARTCHRGDNDILAMSINHCREIASGVLQDLHRVTKNPKQAYINIYGINSAAYNRHNTQPERKPGIDYAMTKLCEVVFELVEAGVSDERDLGAYWDVTKKFAAVGSNEQEEPGDQFGAYAREIGDLKLGIGFTPQPVRANERKVWGTLENVPLEWCQWRSLVSYLLAIPRLWRELYHTPYLYFAHQNTRRGGLSHHNYNKLWRALHRVYALPTSAYDYTEACWWAYTQILCKASTGESHYSTPVISLPSLLTEAESTASINGVVQFMRCVEEHHLGENEYLQGALHVKRALANHRWHFLT